MLFGHAHGCVWRFLRLLDPAVQPMRINVRAEEGSTCNQSRPFAEDDQRLVASAEREGVLIPECAALPHSVREKLRRVCAEQLD